MWASTGTRSDYIRIFLSFNFISFLILKPWFLEQVGERRAGQPHSSVPAEGCHRRNWSLGDRLNSYWPCTWTSSSSVPKAHIHPRSPENLDPSATQPTRRETSSIFNPPWETPERRAPALCCGARRGWGSPAMPSPAREPQVGLRGRRGGAGAVTGPDAWTFTHLNWVKKDKKINKEKSRRAPPSHPAPGRPCSSHLAPEMPQGPAPQHEIGRENETSDTRSPALTRPGVQGRPGTQQRQHQHQPCRRLRVSRARRLQLIPAALGAAAAI